MHSRNIVRLAGACAFGLLASLTVSSSASAFGGLSDKQRAHIEEYIHCKILLLTDLAAFEAEPPCGGSVLETRSIAPSGSGNFQPKYVPYRDPCYGGGDNYSLQSEICVE